MPDLPTRNIAAEIKACREKLISDIDYMDKMCFDLRLQVHLGANGVEIQAQEITDLAACVTASCRLLSDMYREMEAGRHAE